MTSAFEMYYKIQKKIHNTRTLHYLNLLALSGEIGFLFGSFLSSSYHVSELVARYGKEIVLLGFMPYVLVGIVASIFLVIVGKKQSIPLVLMMIFFPSALLTESGLNAIFLVAVAYTIRQIELGHRQMIVSAISGFSEKYSPLYEKRLANKQNYREYFQAFMLLEFFDAEDFILVSEKDEKYTHKKLGIYDRRLTRTFKIKAL